MMDTMTGKRIEKMEVYVSVMVDVADCKTAREAYGRSSKVVDKLADAISAAGYSMYDAYEVFRNDEGDIADDKDEE